MEIKGCRLNLGQSKKLLEFCCGCDRPHRRRKITAGSIIYSDHFRSYNALAVSEFKHLRINHSKAVAEGKNHINGIENFWNQAKRHLRRFNGIPKNKFNLFLKECEFRFNYGQAKQLLTTLKKWIKMTSKSPPI
jgi:transposase